MIRDEAAEQQIHVLVNESSQIADARRRIMTLAGQVGLDETRAGVCALIASEIGTNLVKHARNGEMFLRNLFHESRRGIEIIALDRGPGMGNLNRALRDGHSTAGSSGTGLGAIRRTASEFDIHSLPGRGTVLITPATDGRVSRLSRWLSQMRATRTVPRPGKE